jgi:hypothetical protein
LSRFEFDSSASTFVIPGRAASRGPGIQHHTLLWIPGSR